MTAEKRRCPRCGAIHRRTREYFVVRTSPVTGERTYRICKNCSRKEQALFRADPEFYARKLAADRRRGANDTPDQGAMRRARRNRLRMIARERDRRQAQGLPVFGPLGEPLPVEPFAAWLRREFRGWSTSEIADLMGIDASTVGRVIRGDYEHLSLEVVDRALTNAACAHLFALWYPANETSTPMET